MRRLAARWPSTLGAPEAKRFAMAKLRPERNPQWRASTPCRATTRSIDWNGDLLTQQRAEPARTSTSTTPSTPRCAASTTGPACGSIRSALAGNAVKFQDGDFLTSDRATFSTSVPATFWTLARGISSTSARVISSTLVRERSSIRRSPAISSTSARATSSTSGRVIFSTSAPAISSTSGPAPSVRS